MAIRVSTRAIKQNLADKSVFGYDSVYKSAAPEIAQALNQAASGTARFAAAKKQEEEQAAKKAVQKREQQERINDDLLSYNAFYDFDTKLKLADKNLSDARALGDPDALSEAKMARDALNADNPNFSLVGVYGQGELMDSNAEQKYIARARQAEIISREKNRTIKAQQENLTGLKNDVSQLSAFGGDVVNKSLGKSISFAELGSFLDRAAASFSSPRLDGLRTEGAAASVRSELSKSVNLVLESAINSAKHDPDPEERLRTLSTTLQKRLEVGDLEGYTGEQAIFKKIQSELDQFANQTVVERQARLDKFYTNAGDAFFNMLGASNNLENYSEAARTFLKQTEGLDENLLGDTARDKLVSARKVAAMFEPIGLPAELGGRSIYEEMVNDAFLTSHKEGIPVVEAIDIPPWLASAAERHRDFGGFVSSLKRNITMMHNQIAGGNTEAVLNKLGITTRIEQRAWLDNHGFETTPVAIRPKSPISVTEPDVTIVHMNEAIAANSPAGLAALGQFLMNDAASSEDERWQGMLYMASGVSGTQNPADLVTFMTQYWQQGSPTVTNTIPDFQTTKDALVSDDNLIQQLIIQAQEGKRFQEQRLLQRIQNGMVVQALITKDQPRGFFGGVAATVKDTGLYVTGSLPKDTERQQRVLFTLEDTLAQSFGVPLKTDTGVSIRLHPNMLDYVNLEQRRPNVALLGIMGVFETDAASTLGMLMRERSPTGYTVPPRMFGQRVGEAVTELVTKNYSFDFTPAQVKAFEAAGMSQFSEEIENAVKNKIPPNEIFERLMTSYFTYGDSRKKTPLIDISQFSSEDGNNVAYKVSVWTGTRYETLIDANSKPVLINVNALKKNVEESGIYLRRDRFDSITPVTPLITN